MKQEDGNGVAEERYLKVARTSPLMQSFRAEEKYWSFSTQVNSRTELHGHMLILLLRLLGISSHNLGENSTLMTYYIQFL